MQQVLNQNITGNKPALAFIKPTLKCLKYIFTPLSICIFLYAGWQYRTALSTIVTQSNISRLILTIMILALVQLILPLIALINLKLCGELLTYSYTLEIYIKHLPARYIPGGIWHTTGRLADLHAQGVRPWVLTLFTILENAIPSSIAFVLGGGSTLYFHGLNDIWGKSALVLFISGILVLFSISVLLPLYLTKVKGEKFSVPYYFQLVMIYTGIWILMSLAFYFYIQSFPLSFNNISFYEICGSYVFSWSIGFISIFSPQGIGIFEFVLGNLLDNNVNTKSLSILILGFRAVTCCADMLVYTLRLIYRLVPQKPH